MESATDFGSELDRTQRLGPPGLDRDPRMASPLKRLVGGSLLSFSLFRVNWLYQTLGIDPAQSGGLRLLDFGAGSGEFLQALARSGFKGEAMGCDVSPVILQKARERWPRDLPAPRLVAINTDPWPLEPASYDLIVATCVLHHIPPVQRAENIEKLCKFIKPGGRLVVIEHNPRNPLTRYMVGRSPLDRGVVLVSPGSLAGMFARAGLGDIKRKYLMFFPPRLPQAERLETMLAWLPLGGQYMLCGSWGQAGGDPAQRSDVRGF